MDKWKSRAAEQGYCAQCRWCRRWVQEPAQDDTLNCDDCMQGPTTTGRRPWPSKGTQEYEEWLRDGEGDLFKNDLFKNDLFEGQAKFFAGFFADAPFTVRERGWQCAGDTMSRKLTEVEQALVDVVDGSKVHELVAHTGLSVERCEEIWVIYTRLLKKAEGDAVVEEDKSNGTALAEAKAQLKALDDLLMGWRERCYFAEKWLSRLLGIGLNQVVDEAERRIDNPLGRDEKFRGEWEPIYATILRGALARAEISHTDECRRADCRDVLIDLDASPPDIEGHAPLSEDRAAYQKVTPDGEVQ